MIGILEAGIGLGLLVGPILGSVLYEAAGYCCPFWTLGFLFLTMFPLMTMMLSLITDKKVMREISKSRHSVGYKSLQLDNPQESVRTLQNQKPLLHSYENHRQYADDNEDLNQDVSFSPSAEHITALLALKNLLKVPMFTFGLLA